MKIAWCYGDQDWNGYPPATPSYAELDKAGIGTVTPFSSLYAGVVGGSAGIGAVVWDTVWVPLTTDAKPQVNAPEELFTSPGDVKTGISMTYNAFPPQKGIMTLRAVIDGVPAENYLTVSRSADESIYVYGAVSWNTHANTAPVANSFWTAFINATEIP